MSITTSLSPTTSMSIDMYTSAEAASALGMTPHDLYQSVQAGRLPAYDFGEGMRFRRRDVDALPI
jgi:excisionase family DNA binding protein